MPMRVCRFSFLHPLCSSLELPSLAPGQPSRYSVYMGMGHTPPPYESTLSSHSQAGKGDEEFISITTLPISQDLKGLSPHPFPSRIFK